MPYSLQWLIKNEIMVSQYWGETTEEELRTSLLEGIQMAYTSDYPIIHSITDVTRVTKIVPLIRSVQIVREVSEGMRQVKGWTIVVGQKDPVLKFATNVTRQFLNARQASFDTMPEALDYLKEMDQNLNWDAADQTLMASLLSKE